MFGDQSFDVVLQIDTLQHLRNAETVLRETARVGRTGIVAFPNFAHWPNRLSVLSGRMPVTRRLPYQWYDTPNIRVGTHADLRGAGAAQRAEDPRQLRLHNGHMVRFAAQSAGQHGGAEVLALTPPGAVSGVEIGAAGFGQEEITHHQGQRAAARSGSRRRAATLPDLSAISVTI